MKLFLISILVILATAAPTALVNDTSPSHLEFQFVDSDNYTGG